MRSSCQLITACRNCFFYFLMKIIKYFLLLYAENQNLCYFHCSGMNLIFNMTKDLLTFLYTATWKIFWISRQITGWWRIFSWLFFCVEHKDNKSLFHSENNTQEMIFRINIKCNWHNDKKLSPCNNSCKIVVNLWTTHL